MNRKQWLMWREFRILAALEDRPMSTNELIRVCRLTFSTAYHDLNRLSARGLVVSTHNGRERIYSSNVKSAKLVFDHAVWTYAIEFKDGRNQTWSSRHELMEV